jgi:hypothetical protein
VPGAILRLQSGAGNQAVAQLLADPGSFAPPVRPPGTLPGQDARFGHMKKRLGGSAKDLKAHPSAVSERTKAQQAAVPPTNDADSQGKAAAVDGMSTAKPGVFDKAAFMAAVRAAIEKAAPKDLKEADEFKSTGKADQVKDQVKGQVASGKDASAADIKGKSDAPPDPSAAVIKPVTPMAPPKQPDVPPDPGAAAAMPARAPPSQTDLSGAPNEVNAKMADAKVTDEQLATSNEPQFTDAVAAKKTGEEHSANAASAVREHEAQTLAGAQGDAAASAKGALAGMLAAKVGANGAVGGQKSATKSTDEAARQQIASQIDTIYQHTKTDTETILKDLDGKVDSEFDKGEKEAKDAFEEYHSSRVTDWKVKRYLLAPGGLIEWGIDQFKPLNPELIKIFADARALYMAKMDGVISHVADLIGTELTRARDRIAQGRNELKEFVAKQKGDAAKYAKEAESSIGEKFDELDKSVDDKQSGLVDDLASKYVDARKGIDERITALQDENKGLWDQAKAAISGAIDTIIKLKDMLLGVLARAAGAVEKIVAAPMKFLGNLVDGVKAGLNKFVANIYDHLKKGLTGWLFGELSNAGIEIPETFDLKGIFNLVASIIGLTWANFRTRLVAQVGEKVAGRIEQGLDFVKAIATGGLSAAWQWIVDKVTNLKDMVMDQIKTFVAEKIVMAGIQWLIGLLNPAAAFIKACKMIYDVVMWFVDNGERIKSLVDAILDSVESILAGNLGKVASMVEDALAKFVPVAIGFLASLLGLGGLGEKIKKILMTVQKPVNKVFDFLISKAVKFGKGIMSRVANSKLGKAAANARDKAKAAYAKGKAYVTGKVDAAKKWVEGKVKGDKDKDKQPGDDDGEPELFKLSESFATEKAGSHTVFNDPAGSSDLQMASKVKAPVVDKAEELADGKESGNSSVLGEIKSSYADYKAAADSAAAKTRTRKTNAAARKKVLQQFLPHFVTLVKALHMSGERVGRPPGIWDVKPHRSQSSRLRDHPIKEWHMESEHIIPRAMVNKAFHALGQVGVPGGEEDYNNMHTLLVYQGVAAGKTQGDGGDWVEISVFKARIQNAVSDFLVGRRDDPDGAADELVGSVRTKLQSAAEDARSRTKEEMVMEHSRNGDRRGEPGTNQMEPTPDEGKVDDAYAAQVADIQAQLQRRLSNFFRNRKARARRSGGEAT